MFVDRKTKPHIVSSICLRLGKGRNSSESATLTASSSVMLVLSSNPSVSCTHVRKLTRSKIQEEDNEECINSLLDRINHALITIDQSSPKSDESKDRKQTMSLPSEQSWSLSPKPCLRVALPLPVGCRSTPRIKKSSFPLLSPYL